MSRDDRSTGARLPLRTSLNRPSCALDHRSSAFRPDLAELALADRVIASHYAVPVTRVCGVPHVELRGAPDHAASPISELLYGEAFEAIEISGGWAWGRCGHDGYVGYLPASALNAPFTTSHVVPVPHGLVFRRPDIKSPVVARLPMGARVAAIAAEPMFVEAAGGFMHVRHIRSAGQAEPDPVAVAERLLGAPYGWGGRTARGIDCSGLVQVALGLCGLQAPRDTDQQRAAIGTGVDPHAPLRRGDLVYFPGHVGIMADDTRLLHANAHWMQVVIEPIADVIARLLPRHPQPVLAVRRLP